MNWNEFKYEAMAFLGGLTALMISYYLLGLFIDEKGAFGISLMLGMMGYLEISYYYSLEPFRSYLPQKKKKARDST